MIYTKVLLAQTKRLAANDVGIFCFCTCSGFLYNTPLKHKIRLHMARFRTIVGFIYLTKQQASSITRHLCPLRPSSQNAAREDVDDDDCDDDMRNDQI